VLRDLSTLGIDLDQITQQLEDQGVEKFATSLTKLMDSLQQKQSAMRTSPLQK
jgi:transaldolase